MNPAQSKLVWAGETVARTIRFSRENIAAFARISFDESASVLRAKPAVVARGTILVRQAAG